jgi:hypothetical protein
VKIKEELRVKFDQAADNIVRACKRSLLDIIDMQFNAVGNISLACEDQRVAAAVSQVQKAIDQTLRRRIHNDVSDIRPATMVAFEREVNGIIAERFIGAVEDVCKQCEEALLDVIEIEVGSLGSFKVDDPDVAAAIANTKASLEILVRRIRSSVGTAKQKILASFEVVQNNGRIPAFGRTPEQMASPGNTNASEPAAVGTNSMADRAERVVSRYRPRA